MVLGETGVSTTGGHQEGPVLPVRGHFPYSILCPTTMRPTGHLTQHQRGVVAAGVWGPPAPGWLWQSSSPTSAATCCCSPLRPIGAILPYYRQRNQGSEMLIPLPKATQPGNLLEPACQPRSDSIAPCLSLGCGIRSTTVPE